MIQPTFILASAAELVVPVVVFAMGGIVAATAVVSLHWRRSREAAYNARLKQMMIEQGMSAEDIVRIIESSPNGRAAPRTRRRDAQYACDYERR